jgi:prepilin-type N-terminal cleavage/methylation domain-containing protein
MTSRHAPRPRPFGQGAFTLIELLVVIAIIAVLAGLLFPAAQSAITSAQKTTAKNQAVQIATALTAYETEYGRLPASASGQFDNAMVAMLCTSNDAVNNPRGLVFLEGVTWKKGKGGTNSSGYADPWGSVYQVALDTNYANSLQLPSQSTAGAAIQTVTIGKHVGVWTVFTNGSKQTLVDSWE